MSLHISRLVGRVLVLTSAALVIQFGGAANAADAKDHPAIYGDAQAAAREVVLGTPRASMEPASATDKTKPPEGRVVSGDAQVAARQVLLGMPHASGGSRQIEPRDRPLVHGDAQAAARQLLAGTPRASKAAQLGARPTP
jgi:hypothetical protein